MQGALRARPRGRAAWLAVAALLALPLAGCRQDMHDQAKLEPYEASLFFADGMASRQPVEGTVARGFLHDDPVLATGKDETGAYGTSIPLPVTEKLLRRGRERYDIFCTPCHGRAGEGNGMVVRRGFQQPPSLHEERLRQQPPGYVVDVVTVGFGAMPSYAAQITPEDRWAIAAWIQVLQLSRNARLADLPDADRAALERMAAGVAPEAAAPATEEHDGGH